MSSLISDLSSLWFSFPVPISLPVPSMITAAIPLFVWAAQLNDGCLSSSFVWVQDAYTVGMLVTDPLCHKDIQAVLEGAANLHQAIIHQQLRSWLYVVTGDADGGLLIGMYG